MFARCVFHFPRPVESTVCSNGPFVGISTGSQERKRQKKKEREKGWRERWEYNAGDVFKYHALLVFSFIMIYMSREQRCEDTRRRAR